MSRHFVQTEGRRWVEQGIITPEQHQQIMELYGEKKRAAGLLPLLGGLLVGLGILSFTAANWQGMPQLMRLLLLIAVMAGCYGAGEALSKKGHSKTGIAFIGLGLLSFGAGIVLTAQMFHLEAYDATSWIVWGCAGLLSTFLYRSRFLFTISAALFTAAQLYSVTEFHQFSYAAFAIGLVGLGGYVWRRQDSYQVWQFSLSFIAQSVMLVAVHDWKFLWTAVPVMALYTLGDALPNRKAFHPLQTAVLAAVFLFDWFVVLFMGKGDFLAVRHDWLPAAAPFLAVMALLLLASVVLKLRSGRGITAIEWLLVPVLLYVGHAVDAIYVIVLFVFSLYVLWRGYAEEWRLKINLGTVLFLIGTMTAYGKLTWDFMDKSLFFVVGGALLLAVGWLLNRRKREFFRNGKEGTDHAR
ncbi:hypothetical protein SD70_25415 [Gordoniibacillus kamchatkensis]|uniref:DUF2157 domain-containing protein n=1 Tax=Gordoniibacillus kamchatkensis TaxID=1590651 RepID=A0ABR5AC76_9BACL|nr:DUF2157 domain-containing protein [Paenibacillus sp. VKM B-2647]KIL38629.1 hypothetical protein SD70_25415 [Paenibacillus sp. VKM B-2647]